MVDHEYFVFGLAYIHFEHIGLMDDFSESLNGVLCSVSRGTSMTYSQNFIAR